MVISLTNLAFPEGNAALSRDFFRSPQSPFRSGQANIEDLQKNILGQRLETQFELSIINSEKSQWHKESELIRGSDFKSPFQVNEGMSFKKLPIFIKPSLKSEVLDTLPPKSKFSIETWGEEFSLISYRNVSSVSKRGFIPSDSIIGAVDLALFVKTETDHWVPIRQHRRGVITTPKGNQISLSKIKELKIPEPAAISSTGSKGFIRKESKKLWVESFLKGHGRVFWMDRDLSQKKSTVLGSSLRAEDLLKRKIHSVSFAKRNPKVGIVSSSGIYQSQDGILWNKIPEFKNQDFPLLMRTENDFLVGWSRTVDGGKTFHPYINMKDWTQLISKKLGAPPSQIQLLEIQTLGSEKILIEVETGGKRLQLQGLLSNKALAATDWQITQ